MRLNAIGVGLAVMASIMLAGCAGNNNNNGGTSGETIDMKDFEFQPSNKTVAKGTKVTWINRDSTYHTVTSEGSGPLDSKNIQAGQSFSYTLTEPGVYKYYCEPHSSGSPRTGMVGTITVTA